MSKKKIEQHETEVLVDLNHDTFMRHVSIHVHMDRPMRPEEFIAELADIVDQYQECPEALFESAEINDYQ